MPKGKKLDSLAGLKGLTVGSQIGITGVLVLQEANVGAKIREYDDIGLAFEDLAAGRVDAVICDDPVAKYYANKRADFAGKFGIAYQHSNPEYFGFCLRKGRTEMLDRLNKAIAEIKADGTETVVSSSELKKGDVVMVVAGEVIPGDGEVIEGIASVDESAITGESAPVVRESGGDFCSVTGGTTLVSDWLKIRITSEPGNSFLDRMIALVEGASRKKTPNEIALNTLLVSLTIIFLIVVVTMYPFAVYNNVQIPISLSLIHISEPTRP